MLVIHDDFTVTNSYDEVIGHLVGGGIDEDYDGESYLVYRIQVVDGRVLHQKLFAPKTTETPTLNTRAIKL